MTWTITPYTGAGAGRPGTSVALEVDGYPLQAGGAGGWESLARPRRDPALAWVGGVDETLELPVLLTGVDRYGPDRHQSIEPLLARIDGWGRAGTGIEPPRLRVVGVLGVPSTARWVLTDIAWGEYLTDRGTRIQQSFSLALLRHRTPTLVTSPAKRARARQKAKGKK